MKSLIHAIAVLAFAAFAGAVSAQALPYGANISVDAAKKAAAAAIAEARKNNWTMGAAIVDTGGNLVYYERMDGLSVASNGIAQDKARTAVSYRRPTKVFQDEIEKGGVGLRYLSFPNMVTSEGGELLVVDGKIVGAIGLSGGTGAQDGTCARAGVAALK